MDPAHYNFNIFNSLILAGIMQGLIFGIIVTANRKYRSPATLILVAFIVSFSLDNLQYLLEDIKLITEEDLYAIWFIPFELLSGPLFLLYGLYVMRPHRKFKHKDKLFFVPFVIGFMMCSAHKVIYALGYVHADVFFDIEALLEFIAIGIDLSVLVYLSIHMYRLSKKNLEAHAQLRWFKIVVISLLVLSMIWIYITIAEYWYDTEYWYVLYIGMSAVVYWMGHIGIYKFGKEQRKKFRSNAVQSKSAFTSEKHKNEHVVALENLLIVRKRFLDSTITLDKVAAELNLSKSHLSRIIHAELGIGFPDYLNSLRVEEAKSYLRHADFENYTLLAIGLEAGFNSKTTFNTAFKKFTSITPSEFRNTAN
jgi:AraC-like DNA-binding protein